MAYFGRKPEKPGSVPGAASGGAEQERAARRRGAVQRLARRAADGRAVRNARSAR
jgi:hypothetical protein